MEKKDAKLAGSIVGAAGEKPKLGIMYMLFWDGAPVLVLESFDSADKVLADIKEGMILPDGKFEVRPAYRCSLEQLEMVEKIMGLRAGLFNMAQIAMAVRAQKSGIVVPPPGGIN